MDREQETNRAQDQARTQLDSIVAMVKRLEHCRECDGEDCDLTDQEILEGQNLYWSEGMTASSEDRESYHDEEDARDAILEDPLSVQVRSGWTTPGDTMEAEEYEILLCTGGPAVRIVGTLNNRYPDSAHLEYQDWFTPWARFNTTDSEEAALVDYASEFCFEC
jgi:hypothetical protein